MDNEVNRTEATRQGRRGIPILLILVASIALALIVWFFISIYGQVIAPEPDAPGMPGEGVTAPIDEGPIAGQSVDIQPAPPAIEDPAQAPDASTTPNTPDRAPGGNTGLEEPLPDDSSSSNSGDAADRLTLPENPD